MTIAAATNAIQKKQLACATPGNCGRFLNSSDIAWQLWWLLNDKRGRVAQLRSQQLRHSSVAQKILERIANGKRYPSKTARMPWRVANGRRVHCTLVESGKVLYTHWYTKRGMIRTKRRRWQIRKFGNFENIGFCGCCNLWRSPIHHTRKTGLSLSMKDVITSR